MPSGRSISGRETWRKLAGLPAASARASAVLIDVVGRAGDADGFGRAAGGRRAKGRSGGHGRAPSAKYRARHAFAPDPTQFDGRKAAADPVPPHEMGDRDGAAASILEPSPIDSQPGGSLASYRRAIGSAKEADSAGRDAHRGIRPCEAKGNGELPATTTPQAPGSR